MTDVKKFIKDQLSVWPLASSNFRALKKVEVRDIELCGLTCRVQFNPCRIISTTADVDPGTIAARPCFLCVENRPAEQFHLKFEGRKGRLYNIQVNPYPIFPDHLVVVRDTHLPQVIWHHLPDMLDFARIYPDFLVYYNGPEAGASAPDHLHFQAVPKESLPLELAVDTFLDSPGAEPIAVNKDAQLYHFDSFHRGIFCLKATTTKSLAKLFYRLLDCCDRPEDGSEPMFNLYAWTKGDEYRVMVCLRRALRSHHYFSDGPDHLLVTAGAAEMAGVIVAPHGEDARKTTSEMLGELFDEVCLSEESQQMIIKRLTRTQRKLDVGIMKADTIRFEIISDGAGPQSVSVRDGRICYNGILYDELVFDAVTRSTLFAKPSFIIYDVPIGKGFHWERKVRQQFAGQLRLIVEDGKITAVNRIGVENYIRSVIASEMRQDSPLEYLKAHAIISRSWVLAQLDGPKKPGNPEICRESVLEDGTPLIVKWWDHDGHKNFDVCADDHCQRYQGLPEQVNANVNAAVDLTWGQVLKSGGKLCDARFSKCCGGASELFSTCWEDEDPQYLRSLPDGGGKPLCDTSDEKVLSSVLNDYDLETRDFFRWTVHYGTKELSDLLRRRTGMDFGEIISMEPLQKGPSGRIKLLRINGSERSAVIGKELMIRKCLSENCLKSSAFEIVKDHGGFTLNGRGWGHGVGLCQIGAAVMASGGASCSEMLSHYYPGAQIDEIN